MKQGSPPESMTTIFRSNCNEISRKTMIKKLLFILIALLLLPIAMTAQKPTDRERQVWMKEMQQYKNDYISRKLELSEEQKTKFLPIYKRMEVTPPLTSSVRRRPRPSLNSRPKRLRSRLNILRSSRPC